MEPIRFQSDQERLRAIRDREPAADCSFVYGVITTLVFCKPSCTSKQALDENIRLFDDVKQAKKAGFRACKKCRPEQPSEIEQAAALIERAIKYAAQQDGLPTTRMLADAVGVSADRLNSAFKSTTGLSASGYLKAKQAAQLRDGLIDGLNATQAVYEAGYGSVSRVYERTGRLLGMKPGRYAEKGKGEVIRYTVTESVLGLVLIAWTDRGLVTVLFDDDRTDLQKTLASRFRNATLEHSSSDEREIVGTVVALIDDPAQGHALPLDIRGTAFQARVWQALTEIPPGSTRSYQEIASMIGAPKATRAVANACGANNIPVVIPCHRVIRSNGALGGYAFGIERKKKLLELENR